MNQNRPILFLQKPCDLAIPYFIDFMHRAGLLIMRTFDLHQTRIDETSCTCPHHGTAQCDCQMVVLLVYGKFNPPASVVVHSHNGQTWFSLVEFLGAHNPQLEAQICSVINLAESDQAANDLS